MKKFAIVSLVMVLGASSVIAASLNVPFWRDTGDNLQGGAPTNGFAGFIGIKNNTGVTMEIQVTYIVTVNGEPTEDPQTTFQLAPNAAISWRPHAAFVQSRAPHLPRDNQVLRLHVPLRLRML